jgi:hypothetical protein
LAAQPKFVKFVGRLRPLVKFLIIRMVIREIRALDLWSLATEGTQEIRGFKKGGKLRKLV